MGSRAEQIENRKGFSLSVEVLTFADNVLAINLPGVFNKPLFLRYL
jgi:hypothetical protein